MWRACGDYGVRRICAVGSEARITFGSSSERGTARFGKWVLQRRETARGFARRHDIACPYVGRLIRGKAVGLSDAPSAMGERLKKAWRAWINLLD